MQSRYASHPRGSQMKVFSHHLYEYKKGLRDLVLHTTRADHEEAIRLKLIADGIPHILHVLENGNMNAFFGNEACIEVLRILGVGNLSELYDEEDFMLGIMLGYNRIQQCRRYLKRHAAQQPVEELIG